MADDDDHIIRVRGLRNQFSGQVVHDNLDLDVARGEVLGVVGGSGTGKSVLLRTIVGLNRPADGTIAVFDQDLASLSAEIDRQATLLAGTQLFSWFAVACGVFAVLVLVQRSLR